MERENEPGDEANFNMLDIFTPTALLPSHAVTHTLHAQQVHAPTFSQAQSCSPPPNHSNYHHPSNLTPFFSLGRSQWCGEQKDTERHHEAHQEEIKQTLNILSGHPGPHWSNKVRALNRIQFLSTDTGCYGEYMHKQSMNHTSLSKKDRPR